MTSSNIISAESAQDVQAWAFSADVPATGFVAMSPKSTGGDAMVGTAPPSNQPKEAKQSVGGLSIPASDRSAAHSSQRGGGSSSTDQGYRQGFETGRMEGESKGIEEGRLKGFQDGYSIGHERAMREGFDAGFAKGEHAGRSAGDTVVQSLQTMIDVFSVEMKQLSQSLAEDVLSIAIELSSQIVRSVIDADSERLLPVVREALQLLPHVNAIGISAHPSDVRLLREVLPQLSDQCVWSVREDSCVERGGCIIRAGSTEIDATLAVRRTRVLQSVGVNREWLLRKGLAL